MSHERSETSEAAETSLSRLPEFGVIDELRSELLRASLHYSSSSEIVELCLSRLRLLLPFECLAVYMLNRLGQLDRVGAAVIGDELPAEVGPLSPERWIDVLPGWTPGSRQNDLFIPDAIPDADPLAGWLRGTVGEIKRVVRIPLNGSSQTFGVLEAVNPRVRDTQWGPEIEFRRDVRRLVFIGSALASAITVWRARNEMLAVADVMTSLAGAELHAGADEEEISGAFKTALSVGLEHLQDYRAAILRIENPSDALTILAKAKNADLSWDGWMDRDLRSGRFLAEIVLEQLGPVTVESIESNPALFANFQWLSSVGMRSAACVPMQITDTTLGTLTVFTGFRYSFSELDLRLLGAIANGFAMFWQRLQIHRRLVIAEQSSTQSQMRRYFSLLHTTKNRWKDVESLLSRAGHSDSSAALRIAADELAVLAGSTILDARADEPLDVGEALRAIVRSRQPNFRRVRVKAALEVGEIPLIRIPLEEFKEIFHNLLSNATRAVEQAKREKGEIKIVARIERVNKRDELIFSVSDNGVGIPRDRLERIFDREFTTQQRLGGTGLGLFIIRDIVESYGGSIRAESRLGEGTTFVVRLPLAWITA